MKVGIALLALAVLAIVGVALGYYSIPQLTVPLAGLGLVLYPFSVGGLKRV